MPCSSSSSARTSSPATKCRSSAASSSGSEAANSSASTMRSFSLRSADWQRAQIDRGERQQRGAPFLLALRLVFRSYHVNCFAVMPGRVIVLILGFCILSGFGAAADQKWCEEFACLISSAPSRVSSSVAVKPRRARCCRSSGSTRETRREADRAAPNRRRCRADARAHFAPL